MEIRKLLRNHLAIAADKTSSDAQSNCKVDLSANENGLGSPLPKWYNRFRKNDDDLAEAIAAIKQITAPEIFVVHGKQAVVRSILDCFCEPNSSDEVLICTPEDSSFFNVARNHGATIKQIPLLDDFQLDLIHLETAVTTSTKLIFISSPNTVAGNSVERNSIEALLNNFDGLLVVDESFINFARQRSLISELKDYPNLVVLQNFDSAWGLAALNIHCVFASPEVIDFLKMVNPGSNVSQPAVTVALQAFEGIAQTNAMTREIVAMRVALKGVLEQMAIVQKLYPSDANFLLAEFFNGAEVFAHLASNGVCVKKINDPSYKNALRIGIGSEQELTALVDALSTFRDN